MLRTHAHLPLPRPAARRLGPVGALTFLLLSLLPRLALAQTPCEEASEEFLSNDCQGVTSYGCCTFDNELLVCRSREVNSTTVKYLCRRPCGGTPPNCGWDPTYVGGLDLGQYACGVWGTPEPTGRKPLICRHLCNANCSGKVCGSDGCVREGFSGICGTCVAGLFCSASGSCECSASCVGKDCGSNGCGGFCGFCAADERCDDGRCVPGECSCSGKMCGDDGCGHSCGTCPDGECYGGICVCIPSCTNKQCGSNGCGGSCGECLDGAVCTPVQQCCVPSCAGAQCGPDGCGGVCGTCPAGQACDTNSRQCTLCLPNCQGRSCGPNGCGGTCGTCSANETCDNDLGRCLPHLTDPDSAPDVALPPAETTTSADVATESDTVATPDLPPARFCPTGTVWSAGQCVALEPPAPPDSGGGCSAAGGPRSQPWPVWGLVFFVAAFRLRRRGAGRA